jgi:tRNA(Ile)-lysidine synthase
LVSFDKNFVFIVPNIDEKQTMTHKFKEECRVLNIEPKLRPYLYKNHAAFVKVKELLTAC